MSRPAGRGGRGPTTQIAERNADRVDACQPRTISQLIALDYWADDGSSRAGADLFPCVGCLSLTGQACDDEAPDGFGSGARLFGGVCVDAGQ